MGIHRGLLPHPLVGAVPQRIRSWISYYTPDRALTMRDVERIRRSIIADMDPIYARQLSSAWEERSNPLISKADFDQRTLVAILRAVYLGLHREQQRLSVLDIGSGAGFFVAVANHLQHQCIGCDLPVAALSSTTAATYELCQRAFRCFDERIELVVSPCKPLAIGRRFDLITAGLICFNEYPSGTTWGRTEWEYFLQDIRPHLSPNGRLFLEFNEHRHYGRLRWYDQPTLEMFKSVGLVQGNKFIYTAEASPGESRVASC